MISPSGTELMVASSSGSMSAASRSPTSSGGPASIGDDPQALQRRGEAGEVVVDHQRAEHVAHGARATRR